MEISSAQGATAAGETGRTAGPQIGCSECAWGKVAGCWRCGFRYGQLVITITQPEWAQRRGRYIAGVVIGCNRHSAEGKTPERAARWLRVRLAGLFAYSDACRTLGVADAAVAQRAAVRAALSGAAAA